MCPPCDFDSHLTGYLHQQESLERRGFSWHRAGLSNVGSVSREERKDGYRTGKSSLCSVHCSGFFWVIIGCLVATESHQSLQISGLLWLHSCVHE